MTEAMNFFQAMFLHLNFAAPAVAAPCNGEIRLAVRLKREAERLAAVANEETQNGDTARTLATESADENRRRIFTEIAVWHFNRSAKKFLLAAARFEEAGKIQTCKRKQFAGQAREMTKRAALASSAVSSLVVF